MCAPDLRRRVDGDDATAALQRADGKQGGFFPLRREQRAHVRLRTDGLRLRPYRNARPVIVFDVLFRVLRQSTAPGNVTYVSNITDVDDKINARAARDFPPPLNEAIRKSRRRPKSSSTMTFPRSAACRRRTNRARPSTSPK